MFFVRYGCWSDVFRMDGIQATTQVMKTKKSHSVPKIIAMTANAHADVRKECLEIGMSGFLSKPVTIKDMERCLLKIFPIDL